MEFVKRGAATKGIVIPPSVMEVTVFNRTLPILSVVVVAATKHVQLLQLATTGNVINLETVQSHQAVVSVIVIKLAQLTLYNIPFAKVAMFLIPLFHAKFASTTLGVLIQLRMVKVATTALF